MKTKIAINGFGRIGRNAFKIAFDRQDLEIVAVNDLTDTKTLAHLLKHDSNYGTYDAEVASDEQNIIVNGQKIRVLAEKDPAALPWKDLGVDVVIESTGFFVDPEKAKAHITAGAKKVVLSAPAKGDGATTIVLGVNEDKLKLAGEIISNASCTTNCITPVMAVLEQNFGIEKAMMTTVHSYTASQKLQDAPAKDLREARNAAENIVPTTTGASIAAAKALPALENVFGGLSVRVPTPVVSLADFAVVTKKEVTVEEVNEVFKKAAAEPFYQGILDVTEEELVSSDFLGNSHSSIVDLNLTNVVGGNLLKVVAWYDNEWGYSNRLVEVTADVGKLLQGGEQGEQPVESAETAAEQPQAEEATTEASAPTEQSATEPTAEQSAPQPEPLLEAPAEANEEMLPPAPAQEEIPQAFAPAPAPAEVPAEADTSMPAQPEVPTPAPEASQAAADPYTNPNGSIDGFHRM
ncbi:MAG TPA: type I glyceraldehyde-3-phosphate dehydrogenase [Candidatus Saccharimonadales bacterium]|nr:type I glyceraldehyde-3-phosphate dehydrogenase [Candidatus Saccharimonadales bacterium]